MVHSDKSNGHEPGEALDSVVQKGLEALEKENAFENLMARKKFLKEFKRARNIGWRALVEFILRDYPEEAEQTLNQDRMSLKTNPRDK